MAAYDSLKEKEKEKTHTHKKKKKPCIMLGSVRAPPFLLVVQEGLSFFMVTNRERGESENTKKKNSLFFSRPLFSVGSWGLCVEREIKKKKNRSNKKK